MVGEPSKPTFPLPPLSGGPRSRLWLELLLLFVDRALKKDNTDAILYIDLTATPFLACLRVLASSSLALLLSSLDAVASLDRTFFDRSRTKKEVRKERGIRASLFRVGKLYRSVCVKDIVISPIRITDLRRKTPFIFEVPRGTNTKQRQVGKDVFPLPKSHKGGLIAVGIQQSSVGLG
ncbi:hypothetical protein HN51_013983 [Arachis hypogaea]